MFNSACEEERDFVGSIHTSNRFRLTVLLDFFDMKMDELTLRAEWGHSCLKHHSHGYAAYVSTTGCTEVIGERAKRARHYQGCTNSSLCGIYIYIYMYGGTYAILVAHATHT